VEIRSIEWKKCKFKTEEISKLLKLKLPLPSPLFSINSLSLLFLTFVLIYESSSFTNLFVSNSSSAGGTRDMRDLFLRRISLSDGDIDDYLESFSFSSSSHPSPSSSSPSSFPGFFDLDVPYLESIFNAFLIISGSR